MPRTPLSDRDHPALLSTLLEALASATVVGIALFLPLLQFGAYFCIGGGCGGPDTDAIHLYRVLVTVLAAAAVLTLVLAVRRRARPAIRWHVAVALAGVGSAALFAVPAVDWGDLLREDPPPNPHHVPCYSGSNDCVGG